MEIITEPTELGQMSCNNNNNNMKSETFVVQLQEPNVIHGKHDNFSYDNDATPKRTLHSDLPVEMSSNHSGASGIQDGSKIEEQNLIPTPEYFIQDLLPKTSALIEEPIILTTPIKIPVETSTITDDQLKSLESSYKQLHDQIAEDLKMQKPATDISEKLVLQTLSKPENPTTTKKSGGYFFGFGQSKIAPVSADVQAAKALLDDQKLYLRRQCVPGEAPIRCYVEREKGMMGLYPTFRLYVEATEGSGAPDKFLMSCSKSVIATSGGYFLFSTDKSPGDRESESTVGKLRCADDGSQFYLYDAGENPKNFQDPSLLRKELALIKFHKTNASEPVGLTCWMPSILTDGSQAVWQPRNPDQGMDRAVEAGRLDRLIRLSNKMERPLDYKGRVAEASVKNFQLVSSETGTDTVLLFGKAKKERFAMDVQYPLSPLQAFAICVTVMDKTSNSMLKYK